MRIIFRKDRCLAVDKVKTDPVFEQTDHIFRRSAETGLPVLDRTERNIVSFRKALLCQTELCSQFTKVHIITLPVLYTH